MVLTSSPGHFRFFRLYPLLDLSIRGIRHNLWMQDTTSLNYSSLFLQIRFVFEGPTVDDLLRSLVIDPW